jgi:protein-S-isoprenylcysteine O-methyltransferase Ste14
MFVFVITLFLIIPYVCARLDRFFGFPVTITPLDTLLGIILLVLGAPVAIWCVILFLTIGKGTAAIYSPPRKFVVRGPYKYVRNPMVIGVWFAMAGDAFISHSLSFLIFTVFILVPFASFLIIKFEEPDLEKRFGAEYLEYKKRVSRWLPKIRNLKT